MSKVYIEGPAAAVAMMSRLICYCSIATVACTWYIDFLPPTLFGVSCRRNVNKSQSQKKHLDSAIRETAIDSTNTL